MKGAAYMIYKAPFGKCSEDDAIFVTEHKALKNAYLAAFTLLKIPTNRKNRENIYLEFIGTTKDWLEIVTYEHGRGTFIERWIIL